LNRDRQYYLSQIYLYGTDIIPFFGTIGASGPVYDALKAVQSGASGTQPLFNLLGSPFAWVGGTVIILWFLLRIYVRNNSLIEKVAFVRSFKQQIGKAQIRLPQILGEANPMPALIKLQEEIVIPAADRALMDGVFTADALDVKLMGESRNMAQSFETDFSSQWNLPPNPALRN
jgi:hypothetical protein